MKTVTNYSFALVLLIAVFVSLLFMNLISFLMLLNLGKKSEEEKVPDSYFFAGYELSTLGVLK